MPQSPIRKLVPLANEAKRKGVKVYHLNIGQPDIHTPEEGINAIRNIDRKILEYSPSEGYLSLREKLVEYYSRFNIEVSADDLGVKQISVHFLAVKADCDWGKGVDDYYSNILLVVDYETGEVYDEFIIDASWADMNGTKEQEIFYMLNGPLVGEGYEGGTVIVDTETRTELSEEDIATINEALHK